MRTLKKDKNYLMFWFFIIFAFFLAMHAGCGENVINDEHNLVSMRVVPQTPEAEAGGRLNFAAVGVDQSGGTLMVSPAWEAHEGSIDSSGVYIAPSYKTIDRVSAFVGKISATAVVSIKPQANATSLEIYPKLNYISVGASEKFHAIGKNQYGEEVPVKVSWSCHSGKITDDGEYTAPLHPANDAIYVKTLSATGVLLVDITSREAYKIFIEPKNMKVRSSGGDKFNTSVFDMYGNKTNDLSLRYFAIRGKIDNNGNYLAPMKTGTDEITVICNYIMDSASVEIIP